MTRIYLSPPHLTGEEFELVKEAFNSNWIAPLGPHVNAFETEMCEALGVEHACALSSGTGGLHLALLILGVCQGDTVWCSSLTFAASANAITYVGARPVFIDSDRVSWNMDPQKLAQGLADANKAGKLPRAVVVVDLYGQCADYDAILKTCAQYEIPVIEDAAEALGAYYKGAAAGTFGEMAILSFNGNKIITTGGGGMLLAKEKRYVARALHLATQARDPASYYQHSEVGYNYRMSNVLAAIGRGQLRSLKEKVAARRNNFDFYYRELGKVSGLAFMPEATYGKCNRWITCFTLDPKANGVSCEDIRVTLEAKNIEARPVWKPMHMQPVFKDCDVVGGAVAEELFRKGLCLPSGSQMTDSELSRVVEVVQKKITGQI